MTAPVDKPDSSTAGGRFSRRRAVGAIATGSLAAGFALRATQSSQAQDITISTQLNPDGTTPFNFRLASSEPVTHAAGTFRNASVQQMPRIDALSIQLVEIDPGGVREIHWHPNASEINYVLEGNGIIGILSTTGENAMNPVAPGTTTFIPRGDAHFIQNFGSTPLTLLIGFSSPAADRISVSEAFPWVPTAVLEQVLDVPVGSLPPLPPRGDQALIPMVGSPLAVEDDAPTPYSVALDALPEATFGGGTVQAVRTDAIASLAGMTLLRLVINGYAVREPHWHGNAAEFNYCVQGTGQIGMVAPSGESWTFVVEAGDVAFIPNNWFHYISNIGDEPLELIAFFDDVAPSRIDVSTMAAFFPSQIMAASLAIPPDTFASLSDLETVVVAPPRDEKATPDPAATPAP